MPNAGLDLSKALLPTERETELARQSSQILAGCLPIDNREAVQIAIEGQTNRPSIILPASILKLLVSALTQMSEGNAVTLIPIHAELSTQEAADLLNVSRPYLVKLLEQGQIPYRKVGTRRRVLFEDLIRYKEAIDNQRLKVLGEISEQSQQLNLGY